MYLKNLTVLGFKSFADKTSLNFQPGVTAIVGPNGCGKSNVSDAIRWVLGEQSAKALRGGEMADVIFNGTDGRKATGMAEVSLTIGDVDAEQLRAAGVPVEFNEVTLTRRVFRDGGSEYFLNKVGCRLRDIQQLFLGTGVGRTSYSIMAQGNITQILSSKPDDRRLVFEEAAGITRFKAQKKESLRKLEHTEQNLLRVQDLIREVKRQIGSLQRQAGKARRFKQLQAELQHLDTQLARHQYDLLQAGIVERNQAVERLKVEIESGDAELKRSEDEVQVLRNGLGGLEQEISGAQQLGLELKAQSERHAAHVGFNEERLRELAAQNTKARQDLVQSQERRQIAADELTAVVERIAASEKLVTSLRAALEGRRQALAGVEWEVGQKQESLRGAQSQAFSTAQSLARSRNEINAIDLQKQGNAVRIEKLQAERLALEEEQLRLEARLSEFLTQAETERLNIQSSRGTVEEQQNRLRTIQGEIHSAGQELDQLLRRQAEWRSRLNVLEQLDTSHEGFGAGAQAALKQSQQVLGSLADKIRVAPEQVTAIEAALGHHLQLVLTQEPESAASILADLASHKKGRASIASLSLAAACPTAIPRQDLGQATLGDSLFGQTPALSVVTCDPDVRPLVAALLGRTLIVPDLAAAVAAFRQAPGVSDYVTAGGEILTRDGILTGGAATPGGKAPASILGRKNQIIELHGELERLSVEIQEAGRRKGALQGEQAAIQAGLDHARGELRQQEVASATRQGELNALQNSKRSLKVRLEQTSNELANLQAHEQEGGGKRNQIAALVADLEAREEAAAALVNELTAELEQLRQQRDVAASAVADAKVGLATEEQLHASHARQKSPLELRIRELEQHITRLDQEMGGFQGRQAQFEGEIGESRREIQRLQAEREANSEQVAGLLDEKRRLESELSGREDGLRSRRAALATFQQQRSQLEIELAQKVMSVENLRERIQQKYQVSLDDIRGESIRITLVEEGPAKVETIPPEEMAAAGLSTDWDAVGAQVATLQQKLDEMGPVNLVAIEEYEETEQRHQFLTSQHDDLVKAKEQLIEVLNKINAETRTMFVETFEKIRANFQTLFVEIFGGGKADLRLLEDGDVLESGIEIVARPPGKQLQSISLLSGGEQTMTAVSLLFAIYQVKPSPFCILDELDAPLDESNINRFVKVLKRFIEQSQFIVITHNKRTIAMADVLYGVTMQEQGVSKIVSVRFNKEEGAPQRSTETRSIDESVRGIPHGGDQDVVLAK